MAGRNSKLTPAVQGKVVQAILAGNYFETALQFAGVGTTTGYEWLARGEDRQPTGRPCTPLFAEFAKAVRQAEAQAEVHAVAIIRQSLPENPRLALDFLARRFPERWGAKDRHELTGPAGSPLRIEVVEVVEPKTDADGTV